MHYADHVLFYQIKTLFGNWKCPLEYLTSNGCVPGDILKEETLKVIDFCKSIGLKVRCIGSDQGTPNQKLFSSLGISSETPFFYHSKF
jgi:hypothetical protein